MFLALVPLALGSFLFSHALTEDIKVIFCIINDYAEIKDNLTPMLKHISDYVEITLLKPISQ